MKRFGWENYLSPFTWRYGSEEMRGIFSELRHRRGFHDFWVALANGHYQEGIITEEELKDITAHSEDIDIEEQLRKEREIHHDITACVRTFAEKCERGGGKIHLGATSNDATDNTWPIQIKEALDIITTKTALLLSIFKNHIEQYKDTVCVGWTHLQPAEPTTVGYRLAQYAQELLVCLRYFDLTSDLIRIKGPKGAVGTAASQVQLFNNDPERFHGFEKTVTQNLGLEAWAVTTQTYPRIMDTCVVAALSLLAQSLHKFHLDFRFLASAVVGEVQEPVKAKQVHSSTMAYKRNPHKSERVDSLTRIPLSAVILAWLNGALTLMERTMDDSAGRRSWLPEVFLAMDQALIDAVYIVQGMIVRERRIEYNLQRYGQFMVLESFLTELAGRHNVNRQELHELEREVSGSAWNDFMEGEEVSVIDRLAPRVKQKFGLAEEDARGIFGELLERLSSPDGYTGIAACRCDQLCNEIDAAVRSHIGVAVSAAIPEF